METIKVEARLRTRYTKGEIKQARRRGRVPAAVSGKGITPFLIEVSTRSIVDILRSEGGLSTLIELSVEGQPVKTAIIAELDRDPINHGFLHVAFHNIGAGEKLHTQIPIRLIGTPSAVSLHLGMADQTLEALDIRGESGSLPSHIDVDISDLALGDKLHVSDLPRTDAFEILSHDEATIVSILAVQQAEAPAPKEEAPAAEAEAAE
jgi:large subunit ribosomal protein L25